MKTAVIVSKKDIAGMNIKQALLDLFEFKKANETFEGNPVYEFNNVRLYTAEKESIFCENIDKEINADIFIFATKHQSKSGIKTFSCHSPGNWCAAEAGGTDREICMAPAALLKEAFIELNSSSKEFAEQNNYDIVMECTHHGPRLEKPVIFVEIGSTEKEWRDKEAANVIAKTIVNLTAKTIGIYAAAFGIGGQHTCSNFKKIQLETNIAVAHVCPKYALQDLDEEMLKQAINKTQPKSEIIILDWKGLGSEKERIKKLIEEIAVGSGIEVKRTSGF